MIILSIDSASVGCAVCVWQDGALLSLRNETMQRGQDARLIPLVQEAMTQASVGFSQLDRMAVTRGPGSFTGLRIGLAAARGLGLAAKKPVIGIDRFAIFRHLYAQETRPLVVILESRRLELYVQMFDGAMPVSRPVMLPPKEIETLLKEKPEAVVVGDAAESLAAISIAPERFLPQQGQEVVACAELAQQVADLCDPAFLPRPLYLRAPDVTFPKTKEG
ncbi:MAG: tRNA (adenosine(37)-N6)-threonylcarbamoyltransferase complex dimerization subunit type 1 TsaB [Alphaproteobacteria bacterium]|nr:tRNA (adenosine(37)-N6)-threonylcarbamoyltransferase complex dimerization subunit type 1 TsaB [Alphaproteobacteria bacterium]